MIAGKPAPEVAKSLLSDKGRTELKNRRGSAVTPYYLGNPLYWQHLTSWQFIWETSILLR